MNAERTSHPSMAQVETLIDFLERKPSLAKGFAKTLSAKQAASKEWDRITIKLNSIGGTVKTVKQWIKYWSDKKRAVKKKAAESAASRNTTGLLKTEDDVPDLTNIEERILVLMGGLQSSTHLPVQPFNEPPQEDIKIHCLLVEDCAYQKPAAQSQFSDSTKNIQDNILGPETEFATTFPTRPDGSFKVNITNLTPAIPMASPQQQQQQQQQQQPEPSRSTTEQQLPSSPRRYSNARRPRLKILHTTRRSQRSSQRRRLNLLGMTHKFLQIKQQHLDLNSRMIAVMEQNSEMNHLLLKATKALVEGTKALGEGTKALGEGTKAFGEGLKALAEAAKK